MSVYVCTYIQTHIHVCICSTYLQFTADDDDAFIGGAGVGETQADDDVADTDPTEPTEEQREVRARNRNVMRRVISSAGVCVRKREREREKKRETRIRARTSECM